jgi:cyanophycin synthetase
MQAFRERQERVTVKPVVGKHGLGVSMAVDSEPLFLNAVASAMQHHAAFMVERFFDAPDYRLLFINHQCIAVSQRLPAFVDGDGVHDVLELIAIANADRAEDRKGPLSKIKIDEEVKKHLNRHGMGLGSVPAKDQRVFLRTQTSMDLGGVGVNLDVSLHAEVAAKLGQLTKLLGLQVAEIDVVSSDISSTFNKGQHAILEISSRPRIRLQECPYAGKPVAASDAILDMLFGAS